MQILSRSDVVGFYGLLMSDDASETKIGTDGAENRQVCAGFVRAYLHRRTVAAISFEKSSASRFIFLHLWL
jgi:hypothetical protein